jgi:AraC family transcriptional regulator
VSACSAADAPMTAPLPASWTRYHARLARVHAYIRTHLDEPLDLNRLAEVACLSPYHWHRIYQGLYGESVVATVRRIRLARAADELIRTERPIGEIAQRAGYGSPHAFSRAFRDAFGLPPAQYRRERIRHPALPTPSGASSMTQHEVVLRRIEPIEVLSVDHVGPYPEVGRAFEILAGWVGARDLFGPDTRCLAIFYDDPDVTPATALRSKACFALGPRAAGVTVEPPVARTVIAGGEYAVLTHRGPYQQLAETYDWLYGTWLPNSGREAADTPSFELYLNSPQEVRPAELLTEIHLPLR